MMRFLNLILVIILALFTTNCGIFKKDDPNKPKKVKKKQFEFNSEQRAKDFAESRGILNEVFKKKPGEFQFATSNVLWRASLITLEEIPLRAVDYSGGIIVTEWYSNSKSSDSLRITVRFNSNEVTPSAFKVITHKKICNIDGQCKTSLVKKTKLNSTIKEKILNTARVLAVEAKNKTIKKN